MENIDTTKEIRSDLWKEMTMMDLQNQEILLNSRRLIAFEVHNVHLQRQVEHGLALLQTYIKYKDKKEYERQEDIKKNRRQQRK